MDSTRPALRVVDRRPSALVGRHARLELTFGCRSGRTVLTDAYAEPPLRIGRSFDIDGAAYMILVCSAPGVFAGDCLHQRIIVGRGARVVLVSQSALQVHPTDAAVPASLHHEYIVEDDGELHCHWDPVIPFAEARLVQRFALRMASGSRCYWSDALMSGRVSRGEQWRLASIDHELRVEIAGSLRYLERYDVSPTVRSPMQRWSCGDGQYIGTTIVHHAAATAELAERLHTAVMGIENGSAAVDLAESHLLVARFLSRSGASFTKARSTFRDESLGSVFGSPQLVARR